VLKPIVYDDYISHFMYLSLEKDPLTSSLYMNTKING